MPEIFENQAKIIKKYQQLKVYSTLYLSTNRTNIFVDSFVEPDETKNKRTTLYYQMEEYFDWQKYCMAYLSLSLYKIRLLLYSNIYILYWNINILTYAIKRERKNNEIIWHSSKFCGFCFTEVISSTSSFDIFIIQSADERRKSTLIFV